MVVREPTHSTLSTPGSPTQYQALVLGLDHCNVLTADRCRDRVGNNTIEQVLPIDTLFFSADYPAHSHPPHHRHLHHRDPRQ